MDETWGTVIKRKEAKLRLESRNIPSENLEILNTKHQSI